MSERPLTPRDHFEQTGVVPRLDAFEEVGSPNCRFTQTPEFAAMVEPIRSPLGVYSAYVVLSRLRDLGGMSKGGINAIERGDNFGRVISNVGQYRKQFEAISRGVQPLEGWIDLSDRQFDPARGLATEALFYALARTLDMPVSITSMVDDHRGRDLVFTMVDGENVYLDISSSPHEERTQQKLDPRRDAVLVAAPSRGGDYVQNRIIIGQIHNGISEMVAVDPSITTEDVARGNIDREEVAKRFSREDAKALMTTIIMLNGGERGILRERHAGGLITDEQAKRASRVYRDLWNSFHSK